MMPTPAEMNAPMSPAELRTMADAVQIELTGDTSCLLSWLGLLSEGQKRQLWGVLPPHTQQQIHLLKESVCAPS